MLNNGPTSLNGINKQTVKRIADWWQSTGLGIREMVGVRDGVLKLAIALDETNRLLTLTKLTGHPTTFAMRKETGYKHMDVLGPLSEEYDIEIGVNLDNVYLLDTPRNRRKLVELIESTLPGFTGQFVTDTPFIGSERKEAIVRVDLVVDED